MLNLVAAVVFLAIFVGILLGVRARNGEARISSVWAAQGISLGLVCILMTAGGFLFKRLVG